MRAASPWNAAELIRARADHVRRARRAAEFARDQECSKSTRDVWRDHARRELRMARNVNRQLVRRLRQWSASMFFRKTIGAHGGHVAA